MRGTLPQRRALTWLNALVIVTMTVMPVGMPMPAVPGADSLQDGTQTSLQMQLINRFGVLTEDDLEPLHHDFTIHREVCREGPRGTTGLLISFLWTERLHRPPIA